MKQSVNFPVIMKLCFVLPFITMTVLSFYSCKRANIIETSDTSVAVSTSAAVSNVIVAEEKSLKFIDSVGGKVIKEIPLDTIETVYEEETLRGRGEKKFRIKKEITRHAVLSKNGKFAVIVSNKKNASFIDSDAGGEEISFEGEGAATGRITVLNVAGETILDKELPKNRWVHFEPLISDNGEYVTVFTQLTSGRFPDDPEGRDMICVFDKNGKEILTFPTVKEYESGYKAADTPDAISENGRYLAVTVELISEGPPYKLMTRFYDLKRNTFWDSGQRYDVMDMRDDGIARVGGYDARDPVVEIDLKKYLGG